MEKEKDMLSQVPEIVKVSCFEIHCKEARATLAGKHAGFVKALTELIAQKARDDNMKLLEHFREMHRELNKAPKDIEELVKIKDLMGRAPVEIERIKSEID
jgi:dynein heavy chain